MDAATQIFRYEIRDIQKLIFMVHFMKKKRAISVLSGGLDSTVATSIFKDDYIFTL